MDINDFDLPILCYVKNLDGSKTYFYRNTAREGAMQMEYEAYLQDQEKHRDCRCPIHKQRSQPTIKDK